MKADALRDLSVAELQDQAKQSRDRLFRLRMQHYSGTLASPAEIRRVRRQVARIETVLTQKRGA
jgi:large subunit ribosomal protein L29